LEKNIENFSIRPLTKDEDNSLLYAPVSIVNFVPGGSSSSSHGSDSSDDKPS